MGTVQGRQILAGSRDGERTSQLTAFQAVYKAAGQSTLTPFLRQGNPELPRATHPLEAAANGYAFYRTLQSSDGHFSGEYGGPLFLIPGLVIGLYVTGRTLREEQRVEMIRYLMRRRKKEGGWGL
jgi:hypothetical protein